MMDNDDPLYTNTFIPNLTTNAGYGMTEELRRFKLRDHIEKKHIDLSKTDSDQEEMLENDILRTNPVITETGETKTLDRGRRVKEHRQILNINSIQRQEFDKTTTVEKNPDTGLYTRETTDSTNNTVVQLYTADTLNNEFEPGPNDVPRPYFSKVDGTIGKSEYKYRNPNYYIINLPKIYTNVKSIRLLSVEVPNTLNVINHYNNIILLDIRNTSDQQSIVLQNNSFKFLVIQLTPGSYEFSSLATHIEETLNSTVKNYSNKRFTNLFTVEIDSITGQVSIELNNPPGKNLEFHLRFWFANELDGNNPISKFSNLWYLLGFPEPYQVNSDGTDKYVSKLTNLFDYGLNELLECKVPDESIYHVIKPFRNPDIFPNKYIYLEIKGLGAINDVQNPDVTNFKNTDLFAKIIFNVKPGETTYEFVANPKIFENPLSRLDRLEIRWVDYAGTPVDFQMRNHSFTLEIIEYLDELDNVGYDTRRGTIDKTSYPEWLGGGYGYSGGEGSYSEGNNSYSGGQAGATSSYSGGSSGSGAGSTQTTIMPANSGSSSY